MHVVRMRLLWVIFKHCASCIPNLLGHLIRKKPYNSQSTVSLLCTLEETLENVAV